jgi:hypothetical protein
MLNQLGVIAIQIAVTALWTTAALGEGSTREIRPYDAVYDVRLVEASTSTGPRAAVGTLDLKLMATCEGWETRSHVAIDPAFRDGTTLTNERVFWSMESADGRSYEFAVKTVKGGVPVEAFKGSARLSRRSGSVSYELLTDDPTARPKRIQVPLPRGTLLPVAYMKELIGRAEKGDALFRSVVFNGASSAGPRTLSALITPRRAEASENAARQLPEIDAALLSQPAWDLNLAFFNVFERRDTPNFEVFQSYHASGVTPAFEQEFEDFRIAAELRSLKALSAANCESGAEP